MAINRAILLVLAFIALISPLHAQQRGSFTKQDPYILSDPATAFVFRGSPGLTLRSPAINTGIRNLVLISAGQSNRVNINPTFYNPSNTANIDVLNVYDGAFYAVTTAMPGSSWFGVNGGTPAGVGHIAARVADILITNNKFDRVIIVPIGVGGSLVADWATGQLKDRIPVAMRRLAARGITPATTGFTFAVEWSQGPSDGVAGTSQAAYTASFNTMVANANAAGFSGRWFVAIETWFSSVTYPTIQAAQAALPNGSTIFASYALQDTIGAGGRQDAAGHFNDASAATIATGIVAAMAASGAPF